MNWSAVGNVAASAIAAAAGAFGLAKQGGATDEAAAISAGWAALLAVVQQLRSKPAVVKA